MDYLKILRRKSFELKSIEELQESINQYFEYATSENESLTITGLALYLGTNRQTLCRYENEKHILKHLSAEDNKRLSDTIKAAKALIEYATELELKTTKNATGIIFNLKNNFSWVDKQEIVASNSKAPDLTSFSETDLQKLLEMSETEYTE